MSVHLQSWDVSKNVHSLLRKYDDVTELCRDRRIDLLCLTETLQRRPRSSAPDRLQKINVVHRPRPRAADDDLSAFPVAELTI